jgi:hypothetical protein
MRSCSHNFSGEKIEKIEIREHVAGMWKKGPNTVFWCKQLSERDHLGETEVDGMKILRFILRKGNVRVWTGSSWLRIETGGGHL